MALCQSGFGAQPKLYTFNQLYSQSQAPVTQIGPPA